jgi:Zn-dependent peptidase ImmA (M78 family)
MRIDVSFWGDERDRIAGLAAQLREQARLLRPPYSTRRLIARCCSHVHVTSDELGPKWFGLTLVRGDLVVVSYRRDLNHGRRREVIAHELGHLFLERLGTGDERHCTIGGPHNRRPIDYSAPPETEARCDYFGDELLVPLLRLDREMGPFHFPGRKDPEARRRFRSIVQQLEGEYGVTRACIERRLRDLLIYRGDAPTPIRPVLVPPGGLLKKAG